MLKRRNKILSLALAGCMMMQLTACGGGTQEPVASSEPEQQSQEVVVSETPTPTEEPVPEGYVFTPTDSTLITM